MDVNTVDGFQGQERDVVILSCVRSLPPAHTRGLRLTSASARTAAAAQVRAPAPAVAAEEAAAAARGPLLRKRARGAASDTDDSLFGDADGDTDAGGAAAPAPAAAAAAAAGVAAPSATSAVGFLDDPRRINVALTRARSVCLVVGNVPALETSTHWAAFVAHCRREGALADLGAWEGEGEEGEGGGAGEEEPGSKAALAALGL